MFLHLYDVHIFAPTQAVAPVLNEDVSRQMSDLSGGMGQYLPVWYHFYPFLRGSQIASLTQRRS